MRIISLLPSATEVICLLGLQDSLVGITHECDFPAGLSHLPVVTKTAISHHVSSHEIDQQVRQALTNNNALYTLDEQLIKQLYPDLLVTQSLCNVCAVDASAVEKIARELPSQPVVINLEPNSLEDLFETIEMVALATNMAKEARETLLQMHIRVETVKHSTSKILENSAPLRVVYLEWIDPFFNSGHWIPEIIELAGGIDCLGNYHAPATTIEWQDILSADPDVLVIGCCGYSLNRTLLDIPLLKSKPGWESLTCVKSKRVYMIDGNSYFSRPSPRLIDSLELMHHMLHSKTDETDIRYRTIV